MYFNARAEASQVAVTVSEFQKKKSIIVNTSKH